MVITIGLFLLNVLAMIQSSEIRINSDNNHRLNTNLRELATFNTKLTNSTGIITIMPKCESDLDCSSNGICNFATGECTCNVEWATYVDPKIVEDKSKTADVTALDTYSQGNSTFTVYYKVVSLSTDDVKFCNYERKRQLTALMLSLFVSFGAEHFYLGRFKTAAAKIVFTVACCGINIVYFIFSKCVKDGKKYVEFIDTFQAFYLSCGFLFMVLWTIYDCVNIGFNKYTDGNGIPMLTWS